jgi:hypothetical protein
MGADKNSSRRMNSAYAPNSQSRIPTRVCQGRVVTTDLQILGTNPNSMQYRSTTQEAKDLGNLHSLGRTVRVEVADCPRGPRGPYESTGWTIRKCHPKFQYCTLKNKSSVPYPWTVGAEKTDRSHLADCPTIFELPKAPNKMDRNEATQELAKNTTNTRSAGSSQTVRGHLTDCPP